MTQEAVPMQSSGFRFDRIAGLLFRAGRQGFWPLVDQGVVSVGNFAILIIVARAVSKGEYGKFGLVLDIIFYFNALQSALITYPLTVKGAVADNERLRRLASAALVLTAIMVLPVVAAGLGFASISHNVELGLAGAFAMVTWQIQEVVRRALMAHFRYGAATIGDGLRYLGAAACLWILWRQESLSLPTVFYVIGLFSTLTIILQTMQVGWRHVDVQELKVFAREFYMTGRWMLFGTLSGVVISLCGVWAVNAFHGTESVGEFYAIANFTKPVNPLLATFSGLVTQHAARAFDSGGLRAAQRAALKFASLTCVMTLPYLLALMIVPGIAIRLLYGHASHFDNPIGELALRLWAISFLILVIMNMIGSLMNGIHHTRENFYAQIVNSIATVTIGFPLTIKYGLLGLIIGSTITALVQCISMVIFLVRVNKKSRQAGDNAERSA